MLTSAEHHIPPHSVASGLMTSAPMRAAQSPILSCDSMYGQYYSDTVFLLCARTNITK